jgi:hypothetical protein
MDSPSRVRPNRRRFPRLEVLDDFDGRSIALDLPVVVRDLSRAGFSCESRVPFPPGGAMHLFRFTTQAGAVITVEARSLHCRVSSVDAQGQPLYISGFEFKSNQATDEAVATLVDAVSAMLSLD